MSDCEYKRDGTGFTRSCVPSCSLFGGHQGAAAAKMGSWNGNLSAIPSGSVSHPKVSVSCSLSIKQVRRKRCDVCAKAHVHEGVWLPSAFRVIPPSAHTWIQYLMCANALDKILHLTETFVTFWWIWWFVYVCLCCQETEHVSVLIVGL